MNEENAAAAVDIAAEVESDIPAEGKPGKPKAEEARRVPPEIENFLTTYQPPTGFTLTITKQDDKSGRYGTVKVIVGSVPNLDQIAAEFGTGNFQYLFSWLNRKSGKRDKYDPIEITIAGEYFAGLYKAETARIKEIEDAEKMEKYQKAAILSSLNGNHKNPVDALKEAADVLRTFGGMQNHAPAVDLTPLAEAIRAQGESMRTALEAATRPRDLPPWLGTALGAALTAAVPKLIDHFTSGKKGDGEDPMMKALDKLVHLGEKMGAFKEALSPTPPDKWDRIIGLAEVVFTPLVEKLASLPAAERKKDPTVKMITGSKEFKDLMGDPEGLKKFLATFYDKFGAKRTVIAMESCGMTPSAELRAESDAEAKAEAEEADNADGTQDYAAPGEGGAPGGSLEAVPGAGSPPGQE